MKKQVTETREPDLLRFSTAGSIDDGKSTLIGRLLHDTHQIFEDHLRGARLASREKTSVEKIDFALFTDGLKAEREQGITIDVAYRYFATARRKFIIADTPGHEQYTRNMATGASTANLSIVLVDARKGVLRQTRRHAFIASLLGVRHLVVAVNKMDLVGYSRRVFDRIRADFMEFAARLGVVDIRFIPVSSLHGENIARHSRKMPWYDGESLLDVLETVYTGADRNMVDFRFPVQYVIRPHMDFRGYAGTVASGVIHAGDEVMVLPSMRTSRVTSISTFDGKLKKAFAPMAVTLTLADEIDISRGDMIVRRHNVPFVGRQIDAMLVWMAPEPLDLNRQYLVKHTTQSVPARFDTVHYRVDIRNMGRQRASRLEMNDIGRVGITTFRPLFHDSYLKNRSTGSFVVVDPQTNFTAGAGMIVDREPAGSLDVGLRGKTAIAGLRRHRSRILPVERENRLAQKPATVWITGLVGSGKSALSAALEKKLFELNATCVLLNGRNLRVGLSRELDFTPTAVAEHHRRAAEVARILNDSGLIVICAFVSPSRRMRAEAARIVGKGRFIEVFADASTEWRESHDAGGVYARARAGKLDHVAGVQIPYERPIRPAVRLEMEKTGVEEAVAAVIRILNKRGIFPLRRGGAGRGA